MHDGTYRALAKLADGGCVPCSALSRRTERRLQPLLDSKALVRRRRGRGMVLEVEDAESLRAFTRKLFPHGAGMADPDHGLPPRVEAVALFRDAKRVRSASAEPVLVRAMAPVEAQRNGHKVELHAVSSVMGAACLLIEERAFWRLHASIAIVENLEVFLQVEHLRTGCLVALYAGGRLSRRVLDWLACEEMSGCRFLHCGDYDPVGLDEYMRLRNRLGARATLHVPACIDALFARYGKAALLRDSAAVLARLRGAPLPEVRRLVELMDATGCGLEQEALLLMSCPVRRTK